MERLLPFHVTQGQANTFWLIGGWLVAGLLNGAYIAAVFAPLALVLSVIL